MQFFENHIETPGLTVNSLETVPFEVLASTRYSQPPSNEFPTQTEATFVHVGIGYRLINTGINWTKWGDDVMIKATLVNDASGALVAESRVTLFDISPTPPAAPFDDTKTAVFGPSLLVQGAHTLTLRSKFAAWGLFAGKYVIFAGGAEVYVNGQLFRSVRFEPTASRPYSENEVVVVKIDGR